MVNTWRGSIPSKSLVKGGRERMRKGGREWVLEGENYTTARRLVWRVYAVDPELPDGFWHHVHDAHVRVDLVTNRFHFTPPLRLCDVSCGSIAPSIHLGDRQTRGSDCNTHYKPSRVPCAAMARRGTSC